MATMCDIRKFEVGKLNSPNYLSEAISLKRRLDWEYEREAIDAYIKRPKIHVYAGKLAYVFLQDNLGWFCYQEGDYLTGTEYEYEYLGIDFHKSAMTLATKIVDKMKLVGDTQAIVTHLYESIEGDWTSEYDQWMKRQELNDAQLKALSLADVEAVKNGKRLS